MKRYGKPIIGLLLLAIAAFSIWYAGMLGYTFDLAALKGYRESVHVFLMERYVVGVLIFIALYIGVVALSLPIASFLTVLAGFLFGSVSGTAIVAFAATLGTSIAFILNRFFFREFIVAKFEAKLTVINRELTNHGLRDIFIVRLTPIFPFSLVTIAASLTDMRMRDFVIGTFFGILPFTFIYVNAGTQLARVERFSDIISFPAILAISLIVLAVSAPIVIKNMRNGRNAKTSLK